MRIIQAPNTLDINAEREFAIFLSGSTPPNNDWRSGLINTISKKIPETAPVVFLNPYREPWPNTEQAQREQFKWEIDALDFSNMVACWLSVDSVGSITMFELGLIVANRRPVSFGIDTNHKMAFDITERLKLFSPSTQICSNIESIAQSVTNRIMIATESNKPLTARRTKRSH